MRFARGAKCGGMGGNIDEWGVGLVAAVPARAASADKTRPPNPPALARSMARRVMAGVN